MFFTQILFLLRRCHLNAQTRDDVLLYLNFTAINSVATSKGTIANQDNSGTEGDGFDIKVGLGNILAVGIMML